MTIQYVGWGLDTCSCYLIEQYDDTDPTYTKTLYAVRTKCAAHAAIPDELMYSVIREENSRWAVAFQGILDNGPNSLYDLNTDGSRMLKPGVFINWNWSGIAPNRVLIVILTGATLTTNQRNGVQNKLDALFGAGRVVFQQG